MFSFAPAEPVYFELTNFRLKIYPPPIFIMRNTILLLLFSAPILLNAQSIPVRTVTVFKNGKAMVERSGKIPVENRRYTTRTLPPG